MQSWRGFLVGSPHQYDLRLPNLIDALGNFFFTGYPTQDDDFICVPSTSLSHQFRMALSPKKFSMATSTWPTADLSDPRKKFQAFAFLRPEKVQRGGDLPVCEEASQQKIMGQLAARMNDLTVDVFDIQCSVWLNNSNYEVTDELSEDEFLEQRGLKKHKSGTGRRGGYNQKQRQDIAQQLKAFENLYIEENYIKDNKSPSKGNRDEAASPNLNYSGHWRKCKTLIGYVGQSRQTALLSTQALKYDPNKEAWEKRLARYLAWLWRIKKKLAECLSPIAVRVLLSNAVGESVDARTLSGPRCA